MAPNRHRHPPMPMPMPRTPVRTTPPPAAAGGSAQVTAAMRAEIARAHAADAHPLLHVVHGSKTGLILPHLDAIDALIADFDGALSFVVDACQARITSAAIQAYLARGAIVLLTGSKFMGGPPFSGMALVPAATAARIGPLCPGLTTLFRRAELPAGWPGVGALADSANPGLLLRLEAALFELERFQALGFADVARVIGAFRDAAEALVAAMQGTRVLAYAPGHRAEADAYPIEMRTLVTIDLSRPGQPIDFDMATPRPTGHTWTIPITRSQV